MGFGVDPHAGTRQVWRSLRSHSCLIVSFGGYRYNTYTKSVGASI